MPVKNKKLDEITTELFLARRTGTLTPERYVLLEQQAVEEIDHFVAELPEDARWLRDDLMSDIAAFRPASLPVAPAH